MLWGRGVGLRSSSSGLCRGGWPGSRAMGQGAGGGVWSEEQLLCVCVWGGGYFTDTIAVYALILFSLNEFL